MYYRQSENGHLHYVVDDNDKIIKVYHSKDECIAYMLESAKR